MTIIRVKMKVLDIHRQVFRVVFYPETTPIKARILINRLSSHGWFRGPPCLEMFCL